MKFAIVKEHKDFYQKNGWIEFEDFIPQDQLIRINNDLGHTIAARLNVSARQLQSFSPETLFVHGHDTWRSNPDLRKFVGQALFGEIASELIEKKPLRLGYDQLLPTPVLSQRVIPANEGKIFSQFIEKTTTLEDVISLKGILGGLIICLKGEQQVKPEEKRSPEGIDIFPSKPGQVIFFQPNVPINWNALSIHEGQLFYLIVYTQEISFYQAKPLDPHMHALKRLGYIVHDKLTDKLHPIVFR